jgi:hypothetical protein|tara:strand:- start:522 stop:914 length:393 start_codon:yes stop_codon:yes gene_type:complete
MRTETKNELRQQLNAALSKNARLEKEVSELAILDMPERLYLSTGDICLLLDFIEHAHAALKWDSERAEEKQEINISEASLQAMYKDECRMASLRRSINDQCRSKYEWNSMLQMHEAVSRIQDKDSEMTND